MLGLIGKKIGMTQLFDEAGNVVPVTAIEAGPCPIVQVKTDERDGYRAVQLGFGAKRQRRASNPDRGHSRGAGLDYSPAVLREFKLTESETLADEPHTPRSDKATEPAGEPAEGAEAESAEGTDPADNGSGDGGLQVGQVLTVSIFEPGERVRVTGRSKGKGFQGVVKRHGFRGFGRSHGQPYERVPGSIGPGTDPSRVIKGRKMAGRQGGRRRTDRNLQVFRVEPDRNLIFVRGSVPGARNGIVLIRKQ